MVHAASGAVIVWRMFSRYELGCTRPCSTNLALFKCQSIPKHCCYPGASPHGRSMPYFQMDTSISESLHHLQMALGK